MNNTRIQSWDLSVFDAIPSQTTPEDRRCLLRIQRWLHKRKGYIYLEIGSHLGGTIQPHYADKACTRIYSIDKRPLVQPDERGECFAYPENSTQTMRDKLASAFPDADAGRLETFDADASDVNKASIAQAPDFCFIDGEHTNTALMSDLRFCLKVVKPDGVICTHDSGVVGEGILAMKREMTAQGIDFCGMKPGGSIYLLALGESGEHLKRILADELQEEKQYFKGAAFYRRRLQKESQLMRWPCCLRAYKLWTRCADWFYTGIIKQIRAVTQGNGGR